MALPFFQAKHYTKGRSGKQVRLIVIHTMESGEQAGKAKQVALWFQGKTAPDASAHYCVDDKGYVGSVLETDTAWAVGEQGTNQSSISLELAGASNQTATQWKDAYSVGVLKNAAKLTASLCKKYNIPVVKLNPVQVKSGKGIIGHVDVTKAFTIQGGHTDPGVNFPWKDFIKMVETEYNLLGGK